MNRISDGRKNGKAVVVCTFHGECNEPIFKKLNCRGGARVRTRVRARFRVRTRVRVMLRIRVRAWLGLGVFVFCKVDCFYLYFCCCS
jgi:hypothetical protein